MKILVTGGTGTVGAELVKKLSQQGHKFRVGTRDLEKAKVSDIPGAQFVYLNYEDVSSIRNAMEGVDKVFLVSVGKEPSEKVAIGKRIIDCAFEAGVKHIVNLSSMKADIDDDSPHLAIDKYTDEKGLNYTHLRPNWFMQNFSKNFLELIKAGDIGLYVGDAKMSFIDVRDIAEVALKVLEDNDGTHINKVYELTGSEALTHGEVAQILSEATGKSIRYDVKSEDDTRKYLALRGRTEIAVERLLVILRQTRDGRFEGISGDVERVLGRPPIKFEQYVRDYSAMF